MKHDCDIVRDLMPMCIDGTASEKAREMVNEHVAECPPCDKVYAEMRGEAKLELPVQSAAPEFVTTVKKMRSHRKRRTWLTLLLGVMIAAVVAVAGLYGYYWYFLQWTQLEDVQLSLVVSSDGIALIHAANAPRSAMMVIKLSEMTYPNTAKGQCECTVYMTAQRYKARTEADDVYFVVGNVVDGEVYFNDEWGNEVPVYRMLLAQDLNSGGKVFYLSEEDQMETVSLRGVHLKSPERSYYTDNAWSESVPFITSAPMPTYILDTGSQAYIMSQPTATPVPDATNAPD